MVETGNYHIYSNPSSLTDFPNPYFITPYKNHHTKNYHTHIHAYTHTHKQKACPPVITVYGATLYSRIIAML